MAELTNDFMLRQLSGSNSHTATHIYKMALYTANKDATYAAYDTTSEVSTSGTNYTAAGKILGTPTITSVGASGTGVTITWDFTGTGAGEQVDGTGPYTVTWANASFTAQCAVVFNDTLAGKPTVCVIPFTSATATNGNFTVTLPTAGAGTSMVSVAS